MSEYTNARPKHGGRRKGAGRKKRPTRIIPHSIMRPAEAEAADQMHSFADRLRRNDGTAVKAVEHLLKPKFPYIFDGIEAVAPVLNKDNSIRFLEVRFRIKDPNQHLNAKTDHKNKEYRHIFMADLIWPDNTERYKFDNTTSALMDAGLFVPTNGPAALASVQAYLAEQDDADPEQPPPALIFLWFEGEKARLGIERTLEDEAVQEWLDAINADVVTLGVLAGKPGAARTNYVLRPTANFVINGVNDETLRLDVPQHIYVRDNDGDGINEAETTCKHLIASGAIAEGVKIANPPVGCVLGWDDGDPLPPGITSLGRIQQIISGAEPFTDSWVHDEENRVDHEILSNRKRAVRKAGFSFFFDLDTGGIVIQHKDRGVLKTSTTLYRQIAQAALHEMEREEQEKWVKTPDWEPLYLEIALENPIRTVRNAFMEMVSQGELSIAEKKEAAARGEKVVFYTAEDIYPIAFGIPKSRYNQLCGFVLVRDHISRICSNDIVIPQYHCLSLLALRGGAKANFSMCSRVRSQVYAAPDLRTRLIFVCSKRVVTARRSFTTEPKQKPWLSLPTKRWGQRSA